ncbi:hypothetical protein ACJX0J_032946, partial [Zea mays]
LQRCGKSCRLRWINYLRPDLKRGAFSQEWSQIATRLPGRIDKTRKKLRQKGIDPNTRKPLAEVVERSKSAPTVSTERTSGSSDVDASSDGALGNSSHLLSETAQSPQLLPVLGSIPDFSFQQLMCYNNEFGNKNCGSNNLLWINQNESSGSTFSATAMPPVSVSPSTLSTSSGLNSSILDGTVFPWTELTTPDKNSHVHLEEEL